MRHLHWFQNDLRLTDNPALLRACGAESLLCIYLLPKPRPWCNLSGIGPQRDRFLRESLQALREALQVMGQDLMVL
ncbi:MAG: deoxyribodipyrimidine photo-lyase, partial [Luminiphilus sp.]